MIWERIKQISFFQVDKMPSGVLDAVKPFLDHYEAIDGVDYRWGSVERKY